MGIDFKRQALLNLGFPLLISRLQAGLLLPLVGATGEVRAMCTYKDHKLAPQGLPRSIILPGRIQYPMQQKKMIHCVLFNYQE
ncbi:hypothetical protein BJX76DRAFT_328251 [Aspergillus varians]